MLILRCTQKLLKKKPGPTDDRQDDLVPVLGSWHANLIWLAHVPIVLCVNDVSLLAILLRGRNFPNLVNAFRNRVAARLERMGLPEDIISLECAAMDVVQVQPSNSRSVLASMNDFARGLKFQVERRSKSLDFDALEDHMSETPMGALDYQYSREVALAAFGSHPPQPKSSVIPDSKFEL